MDKKQDMVVGAGNTRSSVSGRRDFFKKAATGAAIITTVTSRPVWAGQCTLSGNLSNNLSNHDPLTHCELWGYSGGAWCEGHADNNNYWSLVGLSKDDPLTFLLGHGNTPDPIPVIGAALKCRGYTPLASDKGLWKQRTAAALNFKLWEYMLACSVSPGCTVDATIHTDFYFSTSIALIMSASKNDLKNANRDGFPP